jgi:hypothetical protein
MCQSSAESCVIKTYPAPLLAVSFLHCTMAAANNQTTITLPPFWPDKATGWFAHMESCFRAKGVMEEWDRFDHTVAAGATAAAAAGISTTTGSLASRPTPARAVQQGLATGWETSYPGGV